MKTIMIVDDQMEVRELVAVTLQVGPYRTIKAKSGEEALTLAATEHPDLIIMDVMMPGGIDGYEATRRLRTEWETSACQILLLTAKGQKEDIEKGYEAGANGYFIKPFSPLELIQRVEEILDPEQSNL
ncbi:response regulator [Desulfoluna sp.]|uniref:response regulator transcription factor n=1 Tax=Desulfoluna sp. TaxID=2045199 RepID=UPI0026127949|nr:response regulator [Desulfoluna sp.]